MTDDDAWADSPSHSGAVLAATRLLFNHAKHSTNNVVKAVILVDVIMAMLYCSISCLVSCCLFVCLLCCVVLCCVVMEWNGMANRSIAQREKCTVKLELVATWRKPTIPVSDLVTRVT